MMDIWLRRCLRPRVPMSTPSMVMLPDSASTILQEGTGPDMQHVSAQHAGYSSTAVLNTQLRCLLRTAWMHTQHSLE